MPNADFPEYEEHPAFGTISVHRVSGRTHLFDSEAEHQYFNRIAINRAARARSLSNDYVHARDTLIEVDMSEAQWAHFLSSHNMGGGVPCTITFLQGTGRVESVPVPKSIGEKFSTDMREHLDGIMGRFKALRQHVAAAKAAPSAKKSDLTYIDNELIMLMQELRSNLPFVADQFQEKMEDTVVRAKIEIETYLTTRVQALGLDAATPMPFALNDGAPLEDREP